jgi:Ca2+-transporting ATPase
MREPSVPRTAQVLTRRHVVVLAASALGAALAVPDDRARTVAFLTLGLGQLGVALALTARRRHWERSALALPAAVLGSVGLMLAPLVVGPLGELLGTVSLTGADLGMALACAMLPAIVVTVVRRL